MPRMTDSRKPWVLRAVVIAGRYHPRGRRSGRRRYDRVARSAPGIDLAMRAFGAVQHTERARTTPAADPLRHLGPITRREARCRLRVVGGTDVGVDDANRAGRPALSQGRLSLGCQRVRSRGKHRCCARNPYRVTPDPAAQTGDTLCSCCDARLPEGAQCGAGRFLDYPRGQLCPCRSSDTGHESDRQEGSSSRCQAHQRKIFLPRQSRSCLRHDAVVMWSAPPLCPRD